MANQSFRVSRSKFSSPTGGMTTISGRNVLVTPSGKEVGSASPRRFSGGGGGGSRQSRTSEEDIQKQLERQRQEEQQREEEQRRQRERNAQLRKQREQERLERAKAIQKGTISGQVSGGQSLATQEDFERNFGQSLARPGDFSKFVSSDRFTTETERRASQSLSASERGLSPLEFEERSGRSILSGRERVLSKIQRGAERTESRVGAFRQGGGTGRGLAAGVFQSTIIEPAKAGTQIALKPKESLSGIGSGISGFVRQPISTSKGFFREQKKKFKEDTAFQSGRLVGDVIGVGGGLYLGKKAGKLATKGITKAETKLGLPKIETEVVGKSIAKEGGEQLSIVGTKSKVKTLFGKKTVLGESKQRTLSKSQEGVIASVSKTEGIIGRPGYKFPSGRPALRQIRPFASGSESISGEAIIKLQRGAASMPKRGTASVTIGKTAVATKPEFGTRLTSLGRIERVPIKKDIADFRGFSVSVGKGDKSFILGKTALVKDKRLVLPGRGEFGGVITMVKRPGEDIGRVVGTRGVKGRPSNTFQNQIKLTKQDLQAVQAQQSAIAKTSGTRLDPRLLPTIVGGSGLVSSRFTGTGQFERQEFQQARTAPPMQSRPVLEVRQDFPKVSDFPKTAMGTGAATLLSGRQNVKPRTILSARAKPKARQVPFEIPKPAQATIQRPAAITATVPRQITPLTPTKGIIPRIGTPSPPFTPGFPVIPPIKRSVNLGGLKRPLILDRGKQPQIFQPSFTAGVFNIRAKKPAFLGGGLGISPFQVRGILNPKKKIKTRRII